MPDAELTEPWNLARVVAPSRVMFGPIVTNLGDDDRRFTARHTAFYARRAAGGCGVIVTEEAAVHPSDWSYERAPLALRCGAGWAAIADACHAHGALVVAAIGHTGGQGSSAYSQRELWAPSRVPEVNSREVPKWMEADDIEAVIAGFAEAARIAIGAGCDGVEINAGQHSLIRQFLSGLTNHRGDEWADRTLFARRVIAGVRAAIGDHPVVGLRLSCDELAPWAGITPEQAPSLAASLVDGVDYLCVVRGSIFSIEKTRPDFHEPTGFNIDLCRAVRAEVPTRVAVVLQGSVVDAGQAEWAISDGVCDAVEMTRAQLADADLVVKIRAGTTPRPCLRCNQVCQVRDGRNPIISCVVEPSTGHETRDPTSLSPTSRPRDVIVVGSGPAGLETARISAERGHRVRVVERHDAAGGVAAVAGPGGRLIAWQLAELDRLGVAVLTNAEVASNPDPRHRSVSGIDAAAQSVDGSATGHDDARRARRVVPTASEVIVQCTGGQPGRRPYDVADGATVIDIEALRRGNAELPATGTVAIFDPIGGPIAVALADELGERAILITQDQIAGNELSRTGDLAPANVRLAQRGVTVARRSILRAVTVSGVELEGRFDGTHQHLSAAVLVDCGFREPTDPLPGAHLAAGDCVAPRTILEAVLEGRRAALAIDTL